MKTKILSILALLLMTVTQGAWAQDSEKLRIGSGTGTQRDLPFNNYYRYALSQQIYTVEELGTAGLIHSIDFYKPNTIECNRTLDIYMVSTAKSSFSGESDWIAVTAADLVFSGTVSFANNDWTTIELDKPFIYDGQQNVAIIIDDNTNGYNNNTEFYTFTPTTENQALYLRSDATNYDPTNPSSGTLSDSKNQIRILKEAMGDCMRPIGLAATGVTNNAATLTWRENGAATTWVIDYNGETVEVTDNPYTLTSLDAATVYTVKVRPACDENKWSATVTFTTLANNAAPYELTTTGIYANAATLNWSGVQDSYNVRYRTPSPNINDSFEDADEFAANWTVISNNTENNVSGRIGRSTGYKHSGDYSFRFSSYVEASNKDYNQYLISHELSDAKSVDFYYCVHDSKYTETFKVGYSKTGNNVADFTWGDPISTSSTSWNHFEPLNLPDGVKYVAINYCTSSSYYYLYIDDLTIVAGEAGEWVNRTNVTSPLDIDGLEQETKYEWQVQGIYNGEPTEWSTATTFTTTNEFKPATAVDLGLPSGTKWADMNVGATSETGYGTYFAWAATASQADYSQANAPYYSGSAYTKYTGSDYTMLQRGDDAATVNWGSNWRMPTDTELQELIDNTTKEWKTNYNGTGVNGYLVTSKTNGNSIFLPAAGWYNGTELRSASQGGNYWMSTVVTSNVSYGYSLNFYSTGNAPYKDNTDTRYVGFSVRPVQMFAGEGTQASPYLIASTTDWNNLVSAVNGGETYSGNYFKMTANVGTVSTWMTGTFSGTFDGDGKTLTVDYSATTEKCAPFGTLGGASIQKLKVAGTITTNQKYAAGIAAYTTGTTYITNCLSSVSISSAVSGDGTHGGLVAVVDDAASLSMTGCAFTGKLLTTNSTTSCGGFVGFRWYTGTLTMTDCLYAPASATGSETWISDGEGQLGNANFSRWSNSTPTFTRCYYTTDFGSGNFTAQGIQARTIAAGDYVSSLSVTKGSATATYDVSGITVYSGGIDINDGSTTTFYGGSGQSVSLALTAATRSGYQFKQYAASQGTLSGQTTNAPTLTMPDANSTANDVVTISAEYDPLYNATFASGNDNTDWIIDPTSGVAGTSVTVSYTGENKVKSVTVTKLALCSLSEVTSEHVGKIIGADGNVYASLAQAEKVTSAVGVLGKVTETGHGLIMSLEDAPQQVWATIDGWASASYAGTTLKVLPDDDARGSNLPSYTTLGSTTVSNWAVATRADYTAIFTNLGSTGGDTDGISYDANMNAKITGAGGTAISGQNWSSTQYDSSKAWRFASTWGGRNKTDQYKVRPVLGF